MKIPEFKIDLMEPTPEEKKNGWTAKTLTEYHRDIERHDRDKIFSMMDERRKQRPRYQNHRYSPHKWRR